MNYVLYYPEEGRYSVPMTLKEAKWLKRQFLTAWIVDIRNAEVIE